MSNPSIFNLQNNIPEALQKLLGGEQLKDFVRIAGSTMAGFRELPGSDLYNGTLHHFLFSLGVDPSKLPSNPNDWQDLAYRFQALVRLSIDTKDRAGVSSPLPNQLLTKFASGEKPLPPEGSSARLQYEVAKIYFEQRDATPAEKLSAVAQLNKLPEDFANIGFCGFGCALYAGLNPKEAKRAVWLIGSVATAELITEPSRPAPPSQAPARTVAPPHP